MAMGSMKNEEVSDLRETVRRLESRLISLEKDGKADSVSGHIELDGTSSGVHGDYADHPRNLMYLPKVRKCNFTDFKNRFSGEDACYAVDVLVSGPLFEQEYMEEQRLRDSLFEHGKHDARTARKAKALVKETNRSNDALRSDQSQRNWIKRIRLQAPALLSILAKVQNESWSNRPRTYDRPFCTLIQFQPQVKQALAELEDRRTAESEGHRAGTPRSTVLSVHDEDGEDEFIDDSQSTLDLLRAYVEFIDNEVIPESHRFDPLDHSSEETVIFSDLCYLFRPGEYIYKPLEGDQIGDSRDHRMGQRIWRVFFVNDAIRNYNLQPPDHRKYANHEPSEDDSIYFTVHAYHIDFTGDEFCIVPHVFRVSPYEGLKPINTLPVYPIRFNHDHQNYMDTALKVGDQVLRFIESKHAFYNDWTVMRTPRGDYVTNSEGVTVKHPEYINSEVMVDFQEAFQACPSWRPKRVVLRSEFTNKIVISDDFTIRSWSGKDRAKLLREQREIIPYRTGVHHLKRNKFVLEDPFLAAVAQNHQRGLPTTKVFLRTEEKILLHCRVFGYVFRERKFCQLDVSRLTPSARNLEALDSLKIPAVTKKLIQGSVRGHFLQKEAEGEKGEEGLSLDVIQGKGTGLFILLHGVPGVGKTATAEAVAQANGKPLFKITCGDIGLTPDQVETSLRGIFRLASIWDCILLMDEVDTFFSQRSKGDSAITKNALVSVFLRVLDYYTGILFLTTNRSGALDEAFKSRIHYKIYYPPLTKDQTLDIWKLNIRRLRQIGAQSKGKRPLEIFDNEIINFAEFQFDESSRKRTGQWNGRQIRNAFQVARSLAYYDALVESDQVTEIGPNEPSPPAVLDIKYFKMMHEITESFDHYMLEVFSGMNDGDLALEMEHRADHYRYRSVRSREDYDDQYDRYYETRSPFHMDPPGRDQTGRPRSTSMKGGRPSITGSGPPPPRHRDSLAPPPPVSGVYEEMSIDERGSANMQRRPSQPSDDRTVNFLEVEEEYTTGRRLDSPFGGTSSRAFGRGGGAGSYGQGREPRRQSDYEADQIYRTEPNQYGKRERSDSRNH